MSLTRTKKIRVHLTKEQINKFHFECGCCRFVYNKFIEQVRDCQFYWHMYPDAIPMDAYVFSVYINAIKDNEYPWLRECSTKAIKDSIYQAEKSFKFLLKGKTKKLRFKSKKDKWKSVFFIKDNIRFIDKKHLWIPIYHSIKLIDHKYLKEEDIPYITGGRLIEDNGKFYINLHLKYEICKENLNSYGYGIDLGIKNFMTIYDGEKSYTIHNKEVLKKLERIQSKINRLNEIIEYKINMNYSNLGIDYHDSFKYKKLKKGESTEVYHSVNIEKLRKKVNNLYEKIRNIQKDYLQKLTTNLVRTKPSYIAMENLTVKDMIKSYKGKSKHMRKLILSSLFYETRYMIGYKCEELGIRFKIADKFYPSSKLCSNCGYKKKSLSLSTRVYECPKCKTVLDRDENAAKNLYKIDIENLDMKLSLL